MASTSFTLDIKKLSKVELNNGSCNLGFANPQEGIDSLLVVGVPPNIAIAAMNVKAGVEGKPVVYQAFFTTSTPQKNSGDSFYTASFMGRFEIRA